MTIAVFFSPHEDLLKSIVQSAKSKYIQEAFRVQFIKIDLYLAPYASESNSFNSVKERETVRLPYYHIKIAISHKHSPLRHTRGYMKLTLVPRATLRGVAELRVASGMPQCVCDLLLFLVENRVIPELRHF